MSFKDWAFWKMKEDKWFLMGHREPGGHLSHVSALRSMQHERKAATTYNKRQGGKYSWNKSVEDNSEARLRIGGSLLTAD